MLPDGQNLVNLLRSLSFKAKLARENRSRVQSLRTMSILTHEPQFALLYQQVATV